MMSLSPVKFIVDDYSPDMYVYIVLPQIYSGNGVPNFIRIARVL